MLARQMDMPVVKDALGTVVANTTVSVTARVQGQLTKAYFKEGQMVKAGDLLFEIDPRPFQAALTQAQGQLDTRPGGAGQRPADAAPLCHALCPECHLGPAARPVRRHRQGRCGAW